MPRTWVNDAAPKLNAANLNALEAELADRHTKAESRYYVGETRRHLTTFAGADLSAKFRQACLDVAAIPSDQSRPAITYTPGSSIDAGATPFAWPTGFQILGTDASESEFAYNAKLIVRATGGTGVFKMASGASKGQALTGVSFWGDAYTRLFQDSPFDASGDYWRYVTIKNCHFNQFQSVYQGPSLGLSWPTHAYFNNFSGAREPLYVSGSDNKVALGGGFFEMGSVSLSGDTAATKYARRATLAAMFRGGTLTKTRVGPLYVTGSPTTPFRFDGGEGGITLDGPEIEGRPSPGSGPEYLWCAGELLRLAGGAVTVRGHWFGFAMRDPAATGRNPGGFVVVTGGNHCVDGGTWQPFPAANYPGGVFPPFAYVTAGSLQVKNITRGSNAGSVKPVVKTYSLAAVENDASVTVSLI